MTGHTLKDELDAAPAFSLQTHASMTPLSAVHPAESPKPKEASLGLDDESAYVFDECPDPQALGLRTLHEFGKSRVVLLNVKPTATNFNSCLISRSITPIARCQIDRDVPRDIGSPVHKLGLTATGQPETREVVLGIPELLDQILSSVTDYEALSACKAVSHEWRKIIKESPAVAKTLRGMSLLPIRAVPATTVSRAKLATARVDSCGEGPDMQCVCVKTYGETLMNEDDGSFRVMPCFHKTLLDDPHYSAKVTVYPLLESYKSLCGCSNAHCDWRHERSGAMTFYLPTTYGSDLTSHTSCHITYPYITTVKMALSGSMDFYDDDEDDEANFLEYLSSVAPLGSAKKSCFVHVSTGITVGDLLEAQRKMVQTVQAHDPYLAWQDGKPCEPVCEVTFMHGIDGPQLDRMNKEDPLSWHGGEALNHVQTQEHELWF